MAIEPIKGFYVHDEVTDTDGVAKYDYGGLVNAPNVSEITDLTANLSVGTIVTNVNIGAVVDVNTVDTSQTAWRHLVVACNEGDKFTISGGGGNGARLWAFTDADYKLLSKSDSGVTATDLELTAPADGYFVYNTQISSILPTPSVVMEGVIDVSGRLDDLDSRVSVLEETLEVDTDFTTRLSVGTITTNVSVGDTVDVTNINTAQTAWRNLVVACRQGDVLTITGGGGNGARLWAFTDADYKLLSKSDSGVTATDLELTAPANGYFVYNAQVYGSLPAPSVVGSAMADIDGVIETVDNNTGNIEKIMGYVFNDKYHINPSIPTSYTPMGDYTFPDMSYDPEEFTINDLYTMFDSLGLEKTHPGNDATNTYYVWAYKHLAGKLSLSWSEKKPVPTVFVVAGIHGDEKSTCLAVYTMLRNIVNRSDPLSEYLADNVNIVAIPCANPWGFMNNSRENSNGVNINRNFPDGWTSSTDSGSAPLSERESINIANTLSENSATMAYVIDYHTTGQTAIVPAINTLAIMTDLAIYPNEQVGYSTLYAGNVSEAYVHELDSAYISTEVCGQLITNTPAGSFCRYASSLKYNASLLEITPRLRSESTPYGELSNKLANKLLLETIRNGLMHQ